MEDYAGNSKKQKDGESKPEKKIDKVISGEATVHKKTLGRKLKDVVVQADLRSVSRYVFYDVLFPAAKNMVVDAATKGIERTVYGDSAIRRRNMGMGAGPRVTYNQTPSRVLGYPGSGSSRPQVGPGPSRHRASGTEFILSTREDAELVLERMNDLIETYDVCVVSDLNDLLGLPQQHVDNNWGWTTLINASIHQIREGFMLDLPPVEQIR